MVVNNHFRQANYAKLGNTNDGSKSLNFGRADLLVPVEMVCRRKPVASPIFRPLGFLPFLNQSGHAAQSMICVFQLFQFIVLQLLELASYQPLIGFAAMM